MKSNHENLMKIYNFIYLIAKKIVTILSYFFLNNN